jgi:hypothetical protein
VRRRPQRVVLLAILSLLVSMIVSLAVQAPAQAAITLSRYAGTGQCCYNGESVSTTSAFLGNPGGMSVDIYGNTYVAEHSNKRIRKITPSGSITTVAGTGNAAGSYKDGENGPAIAANLGEVSDIVAFNDGAFYFVQDSPSEVRYVSSSGVITTVAGDGLGGGYNGDNIDAKTAKLYSAMGLAYDDASGALYIADTSNFRIRKVYNGIITTIAGTGNNGFYGDGGQATSAWINLPRSMKIVNNHLYFSDYNNSRVRVIDLVTGIISTVAGNGGGSYLSVPDGGVATSAYIGYAPGLEVDAGGNIYIGNQGDGMVYRVTPDGIIHKLADVGIGVGHLALSIIDDILAAGYNNNWDVINRLAGIGAAANPVPPSNDTVAVQLAAPKDAPYTRQISIKLSNTSVGRWQYGWSSSGTTAPPTGTLQESTAVSAKTGTLNYLGSYSGNGTTWDGGTQPNSDWYLWVRSVSTDEVASAWGTPLLVHTPRRPAWVGLGDSYSSGHHQDTDEVWCPTAQDAPTYYAPGVSLCMIQGAPHYTPNDLNYSWVKKAVDSFNTATHAPTGPSGWSYGLDLVAFSGAWTSSFGVVNTTPGTDGWASGTSQSFNIREDLRRRYDSWNVVSMTGGGNDAQFADRLRDFYANNYRSSNPTAPWAVSTTNPSVDCPDSQKVWDYLKATQLDGRTLDQHIQDNLQGVVTVAARVSPGVRVINMGYPYMVDAANSCSADTGSWHGSKSVMDSLNIDHSAVTGANVHYISLTDLSGFGPNPTNNLQLRRLYGYPHPVDTGQNLMANLAVSDLTTGAW